MTIFNPVLQKYGVFPYTVTMSYAQFVNYAWDEPDDSFLIQVLSKHVRDATLTNGPDSFHGYPGSTGNPVWSRAVRGTALRTGWSRVSDPAILDWTAQQETFPIIDLENTHPNWLFSQYMKTPIQLREQGILLTKGSLTALGTLPLEPGLDNMEFNQDKVKELLAELDKRSNGTVLLKDSG